MNKISGVANNVTSVAGAGLRLSLLLNAVACQVANLGIDIHSISKGISLFSTTLKQVGQSLQGEHCVHTRECLDTAQQISLQARTVFGEVENMLDEVQRAEEEDDELDQQDVSVQQRFKTCFKKQRVMYLLAQLELLKLSLMVLLQVLYLGRLQEANRMLNAVNDELITQERADAQNMLVVRYWSTRKIDRLWDLAQQEAKEDRRPKVAFASSSNQRIEARTDSVGSTSVKLPIIPLGVESSLNSLEESPNDMLRLTEEVVDALLKRWVRARVRIVPQASVSSGSDDEVSDDDIFDRESAQGYYIEGATTDWRKPHSQEARIQAAQLRKQYSDKQAHVSSDSDGSEDSTAGKQKRHRMKSSYNKSKGLKNGDFVDMPEPEQMHSTDKEAVPNIQQGETMSRPYSYSPSNLTPGLDPSNHRRHEGATARPQPISAPSIQIQSPTRSQPIPIPQANINRSNSDRLATSQPIRAPSGPSNYNGLYANSSSYYKSPNGFPAPSPTYLQQPSYPQQYQQQQYRQYSPTNPPTFIRAQSDNSRLSPQMYQVQQQQQQLHRQRSSRSNRKSTSNSTSASNSRTQSPKNRHKDLKRTALRAILGVNAIGVFMDALEAFSIM